MNYEDLTPSEVEKLKLDSEIVEWHKARQMFEEKADADDLQYKVEIDAWIDTDGSLISPDGSRM